MKFARFFVASTLATLPALGAQKSNDKLDDARLVQKLHAENQEEIEAGRLAQKLGSSEQAKEFGRMLVDEHTKDDQLLLAAAKKDGLEATSKSALTDQDREEERTEKAKLAQVGRMSGAEFDKAFGQVEAHGHHHLRQLLEQHEDDVQHPDLKQMTVQLIPQLTKHEEAARRLSGGGSGGDLGGAATPEQTHDVKPRDEVGPQNEGH